MAESTKDNITKYMFVDYYSKKDAADDSEEAIKAAQKAAKEKLVEDIMEAITAKARKGDVPCIILLQRQGFITLPRGDDNDLGQTVEP